ncbi:MAG: dTDP-6-deoxy-3,4-keto-hexulose isomerase [uncultured Sulfurovum sp.]|uniref:dTDP-6-deoxy-3,4-keto-hexulose isomerase n=1 Tax=uncultured Sulfurovum sp. TaxID=269237 RepID=A0A6S6TWA9_9BACT|nr:MAG: dTDP-6-deoxy-3,4-keto-hexulose isomerase [uncultured Sulfurovum sp.]
MLAKLIKFESNRDERGALIALEDQYNVPFEIKRVYYIFDTKEKVRRGGHAHKDLKQLAICLKGSCKFLLTDGRIEENIELNSPEEGLLLEHCLWREMYNFSTDCILLLLADKYYDEDDYIRDYSDYLKMILDVKDDELSKEI